MNPTAIVLILLGLLGPVAAAQWRMGRWMRPAAWIATRLSPQFLAGVPMFGILLVAVGISFIWPPGIFLVFFAAGGLLWVLFAATDRQAPPARPRERPSAPGSPPAKPSAPDTPTERRRQAG
jgi:peptidoglycan/LPS O-acetylase OafA/YrhL